MPRIIITSAIFIFLLNYASAQQFWLTTYEFPGGPKTCLTRYGDSTLFVGTASGIMRSYNQGFKFDTALTNPGIVSLLATNNQILLAGTRGKIYRSTNWGNTWDSIMLNQNFPVIKFIEKSNGHLFAITGLTDLNGYTGAGVYFSDNNGITWTQRNNGLGGYLCCDEITADKNGRLYVAVADEFNTGNAGLFYSDNEGLQWNHVDITIDGRSAINDSIQLTKTSGLAVSPADSLFISFEGVANNVAVNLNICKSIADITANNKWSVLNVRNNATWWNDGQMNTIHFAKNGDRYSSVEGSINVGATLYSKSGTNTWNKQTEGLGLALGGVRNYQVFTETSDGKIFMVQLLGELINVTDTSHYTPTGLPENENGTAFKVYPNPVSANTEMTIEFEHAKPRIIQVQDFSGCLIKQGTTENTTYQFSAPLAKGIYFLVIQESNRQVVKKLTIL